MTEQAKGLAKRIIHEVNLGMCLEDPTHEAEIEITRKLIEPALLQAKREEALAIAKAWDEMKYGDLAKQYPMDAYPKWGNIFAAWCRQRAKTKRMITDLKRRNNQSDACQDESEIKQYNLALDELHRRLR